MSKRKRFYAVLCIFTILSVLILNGCDEDATDAIDSLSQTMNEIGEEASAEENFLVMEVEPAPAEAENEETGDIEAEENSSDNEASAEAAPEESGEEENPDENVVDLIFFMGQSNMAGCGGNAAYAPKVEEGHGYEFRAISDPTRLYPVTEPFGINENNLNAIMDLPGAKKGSLVSSFINTYYDLTKTPVVAVSASAGATDTAFWMSDAVVADYEERIKRAVVWLEAYNYKIRHKYVIWLQGESDAIDNLSTEKYIENMDNIIRPMFINGVEKVFFITPGRTITRRDYFEKIIAAQIKMSKDSSYYALGTTVLSGISTEYMVDEWHYNQTVLNLVGKECAQSVACFTNNGKECSLYDYRNQTTFIPGEDYYGSDKVEPLDFSKCDLMTKLD